MAQFKVYCNLDAATRTTTPYLLDVQSDLLSDLSTRVVAPLRLAAHYSGKSMTTLMPGFSIEGQEVIALIQQLAAVPPRAIGAEVADLSDRRFDIIAALDFLISGY